MNVAEPSNVSAVDAAEPSKKTLKKLTKRPTWETLENPRLLIKPNAWAKILHMRDAYQEEVAAYGISSKGDLLTIDDVWIPQQEVSSGSFEFDSDDVSDRMGDFFDAGIEPVECCRIWIHTHPSGVNQPSSTDEETFNETFAGASWSLMLIAPKNSDNWYAALRMDGEGYPSIRIKLPVVLSCSEDFEGFDLNEFKKEIDEKVSAVYTPTIGAANSYKSGYTSGSSYVKKAHTQAAVDDAVDDLAVWDEEFPFFGDCCWCHSQDCYLNEESLCRVCTEETESYVDGVELLGGDSWTRE